MREYLNGEYFEYYVVCPTKLWFHHHRMIDAKGNEYVELGSVIDEQSYEREDSLNIGSAVVDFVETSEDRIIVNEVKKSSALERAHKLQVLHYLSILEPEDEDIAMKGIVRYPQESKTVEFTLSENREEYERAKSKIWNIVEGEMPDIVWKDACKKCSMREFCHS